MQTAKALKNSSHSYRAALNDDFKSRVRVFDIGEMTHIRPQDLRDNCCVVVATMCKAERESGCQSCLFALATRLEINFDNGFAFRKGVYADMARYKGAYRFTKHFLGPDHVPAFDGAIQGEEYKCAVALDSLPMVKHWLRNVAKHPASFRLPTASGWFYPDFVAELTDGRIFALDYKGADRVDNDDTNEKRTVGRLWEQVGNGKTVFMIVEKDVGGADPRAQMMDYLSR